MWRTLLADDDPLETLSVDGQLAARLRRRCHPCVLQARGGVLPMLLCVESGTRQSHLRVSLVRRCTMQRNRLQVAQLPDDCIAIVHFVECCNAIVQFCTKNCIFSCSLLFLSPFGPPQQLHSGLTVALCDGGAEDTSDVQAE